MLQGPNNNVDRTSENLNDALATIASELARADAKASVILAVTTVGLGFVATRGYDAQPPAVLGVGASGAVCLMIATVLLLLAVRPVHIDTASAEGWSRWAKLEPEALREHMRVDLRAERVAFLARMVRIKFRRLRLAVNFILAGLGLLFMAAVLSLFL